MPKKNKKSASGENMNNQPNYVGDDAIKSLPNSLIQQINEFSTGGFVIFIKGQGGNPFVIEKYDSSVDAIGIRKFIQVWGNVSDNISENMIAASLLGVDPEDLDDMEDFDGSDE